MKKLLIGILLLVGLAIITNPNETKHKEAVKREIDAALEKELGSAGEFLSATFDFKGKAIGTFVKRENNYVYSTTKLKIGPEEKVIGYGFFGFVVINRSAITN